MSDNGGNRFPHIEPNLPLRERHQQKINRKKDRGLTLCATSVPINCRWIIKLAKFWCLSTHFEDCLFYLNGQTQPSTWRRSAVYIVARHTWCRAKRGEKGEVYEGGTRVPALVFHSRYISLVFMRQGKIKTTMLFHRWNNWLRPPPSTCQLT